MSMDLKKDLDSMKKGLLANWLLINWLSKAELLNNLFICTTFFGRSQNIDAKTTPTILEESVTGDMTCDVCGPRAN